MEKIVIQASIHWEAANAAALAAIRKAEELEQKVSVVVLDRGGHVVAALRSSTSFHTGGVAENKAYTAISFGMPTSKWADFMEAQSPLVQQGLPMLPKIAMFGGGLPIEIEGELAGAIGVSGASEEQDAEIASAGIAAIR